MTTHHARTLDMLEPPQIFPPGRFGKGADLRVRKMKVGKPALEGVLNTIQCGDAANVLRQLPNRCADLIITSPPYYQQRRYNGSGVGIGQESHIDYYIEALMETFTECVRVLKPTGNIVYNLGDKYIDRSLSLVPFRFAIMVCERFNLRLVNEITWVKRNPTPRQFTRRLVSSTEPFFHFAMSDEYYYDRVNFCRSDTDAKTPRPGPNLGNRYRQLIRESKVLTDRQKSLARKELNEVIEEVRRGDIHSFRMKIRGTHAEAFGGEEGGRKSQMERKGFTIIRMRGEKMKRDVIEHPVETLKGNSHTAVFPLAIIQEMIRLLCPKKGFVIDPYVGSGTSAVAAIMEGRDYLGIDIDPEYCALSEGRIQKLKEESS